MKKYIALFAILLSLTACKENDAKSTVSVAEQKCSNEKIRVEMDGNILEFKREDVKVYVENPNKEDVDKQYLDLSQDCSVDFANNIYSVSARLDYANRFKNRSSGFSITSPENSSRKISYLEYSNLFNADNAEKIKITNGIRNIILQHHGVDKGYFLFEDTQGIEKAENPIIYVCDQYLGCETVYMHPSGLVIGYSTRGNFKKMDMQKELFLLHQAVDSVFFKTNNLEEKN